MWVYGLCRDCNSDAGGLYDEAYADFARQVQTWADRSTGPLLIESVPFITLAPGLVARSVLHGMHAISPHLRELYPMITAQLAVGDPVTLPGNMQLRLAGHLGPKALLVGAMLTADVLGTGRVANTLASFTFRPLSWALVGAGDSRYFDERGWLNVTEWLRYENDRTNHDLRWLTPKFGFDPKALHRVGSQDSMQLFSDKITPYLEGHIPVR